MHISLLKKGKDGECKIEEIIRELLKEDRMSPKIEVKLDGGIRAQTIHWMLEVTQCQNLSRRTFFRAASLFDRTYSSCEERRTFKGARQAGLRCIRLADVFENGAREASERGWPKEESTKLEELVLQTVNLHQDFNTIEDCLENLIELLDSFELQDKGERRVSRMKQVADLCAIEEKFLNYSPLTLAVAIFSFYSDRSHAGWMAMITKELPDVGKVLVSLVPLVRMVNTHGAHQRR